MATARAEDVTKEFLHHYILYYRMNDVAQCRTTPSPTRCISKRLTSRHTISACEFKTFSMYARCFLIGSVLSEAAICCWEGVSTDFPDGALSSDKETEADFGSPGLSMISTTASSTFRSSSARMLTSVRLLDSSFSSSRIRARE